MTQLNDRRHDIFEDETKLGMLQVVVRTGRKDWLGGFVEGGGPAALFNVLSRHSRMEEIAEEGTGAERTEALLVTCKALMNNKVGKPRRDGGGDRDRMNEERRRRVGKATERAEERGKLGEEEARR